MKDDAGVRAARSDVEHRSAYTDYHRRCANRISIARAAAADKTKHSFDRRDRDLLRRIVRIENKPVDDEAGIRADDDLRIVDELDLGEANGTGDDLVAHEDGAFDLEHTRSGRPARRYGRVDPDSIAAGLNGDRRPGQGGTGEKQRE
jgi:hypothetical protein